jgi:hypothetical protein
MGRYDAFFPQVLYGSSNILVKHRWRYSQVLANHFQSKFFHYYLPSLQKRQMWRKDGRELTMDQVVLIVDPELP